MFLAELLIRLQTYDILFWGWLGGYKSDGEESKSGRLLTIEQLGEILKSLYLNFALMVIC